MVWTEEAPGAQVKTLWVTEVQREMALKCLSQVRSTRQKDEPGWGGVLEGAAIHNHKNIKQGRADEPEEKNTSISSSPPLPTCSYCFLTSYRHQGGWDAEHSLLTHRRSRVSPWITSSPCHRAPKQYHAQKSEINICKKRENFEHICWNRPIILRPVQNASKVIDSFCKWLQHCQNRKPPGAQLSFPNGGGNCFISGLLIHHSENSTPFWFFS